MLSYICLIIAKFNLWIYKPSHCCLLGSLEANVESVDSCLGEEGVTSLTLSNSWNYLFL